MKKALWPFILTVLVSLNVKSQVFTLNGTLTGVEDGTEIRMNPHLENGMVDIDDQTSIILKDGKFEFKRILDRPTKFSLRTMPKIPPDNPLDFEYCTFWAENNPMTLVGKKGEIQISKITGSSIQQQYEVMVLEIAGEINKIRELQERSMNERGNLSKEEKKTLSNQIRHYHNEIEQKRHKFILNHPQNYFAGEEIVFSINHFVHAYSKIEIQDFFDKMPLDIKSDIYGRQIAEFLNKKDNYNNIIPLQIGDEPHDFKLPNEESVHVTFSSIKGEIILLDFWASGCSPCRKEHQNYVALYKKYKNKGFEIVSVSQDQSKARWLKAIEKDKMTWVSLWDADGKMSRLKYMVTALPANFLINEQGVIVAKNVRGEKLKSELEKLFE